jgi:hypothetical protein
MEKPQSKLVVLSDSDSSKNALVALKKYTVTTPDEYEAAMSLVTPILEKYFQSLEGERVCLLLVPNADTRTETHLLPVVKKVLQSFRNIVLYENPLYRLPGQLATRLSKLSGTRRDFEQRQASFKRDESWRVPQGHRLIIIDDIIHSGDTFMIVMDLFPEATFVAIAGSLTFMRSSADHALTSLELFVQERMLSRQLDHLEKVQLQQRACMKPSELQMEEANKTTESVRSLMRQLLFLLTSKVTCDDDKSRDKPDDIPLDAWDLALKLRKMPFYSAERYTLESWARLFASELTPKARAVLAKCTQKEHNHLVDSASVDTLKSWLVNPHHGKIITTKDKEALVGDIPGEAYVNLCKLSGN